jgi:hypothetical protein
MTAAWPFCGATATVRQKARLPVWVTLRSPGAQEGSPLCPQEQTSSAWPVRSEKCRLCCKSRFSPMTKILRAVGATFVYKMRGTSRPRAKFTGDFGSAIEVIRISDRSLLSIFAKNLEPCNFRLLQQYLPEADVFPPSTWWSVSSSTGRSRSCRSLHRP